MYCYEMFGIEEEGALDGKDDLKDRIEYNQEVINPGNDLHSESWETLYKIIE